MSKISEGFKGMVKAFKENELDIDTTEKKTKKITWDNLDLLEKNLLSSICPECQCQMLPYPLLLDWQKCGACGYTRQHPIESEEGHKEFELISK